MKRWKSEYFVEVIKYCQNEYKAKVIVTSAPNEKKIIEEINKLYNKNCLFLSDLSIREFCLLIARYHLLITVDTSAVHIAAATRTPTIALFGPTDPICWGPANKKNQIMVQTHIACQPCEKTIYNKVTLNQIQCPFEENYCLTQLSPEIVYTSIDKLIKG